MVSKTTITGSKRGAPHEHPVVVSHFLPGTATVVTVDTSGTVNKSLFTNQMVRWNAKTDQLFDGAQHGRITTVEILPPSNARSPTNHKFLTAMASKDKVFVVTLEPKIQVCYTMEKPAGVSEGALPYLSWRPDLRRGKNALKQNGDPMLVIAWGKKIVLLQAMLSWLMMEADADDAEVKLIPKGEYECESEIQLITYLNPQVFVFVDVDKTMRVFDPSTFAVMETTEIRSLGLVFHSFFLQLGSSDRGMTASAAAAALPDAEFEAKIEQLRGRVSEALQQDNAELAGVLNDKMKELKATQERVVSAAAAADEEGQAFHHSITLCDEKIYMLGREQVTTCRVYSWTERIDMLKDANNWEDALSLGLDFFEGKAKAADGLPTEADKLHLMVGDHMSEIVGNARIKTVGKSQSCMVSKLPFSPV